MGYDFSNFLMGQTIDAYKYFGAHFVKADNKDGVVFRLYAPMADDVSVIGDFNNWDITSVVSFFCCTESDII